MSDEPEVASSKYYASCITTDNVLYVTYEGSFVVIDKSDHKKASIPYGDRDKAVFIMGLWLTLGWSFKDIMTEQITLMQKFKFMTDMGLFDQPSGDITEE